MLASMPIALIGGYGLNTLLAKIFHIDLPQHSFWRGGFRWQRISLRPLAISFSPGCFFWVVLGTTLGVLSAPFPG